MLIFGIFEPNDFWKVVDWIVTNVHEKGKIQFCFMKMHESEYESS